LKITPKEKRYIAIGAVVLAAALIFYGFSLIMENRAAVTKKVELKKRKLEKQSDILTQKALYIRQLDQYNQQLQNDMNRLLPGNSPNMAVSELGRVIDTFANTTGVDIIQKNPQPEKKIDDKLVRVSVQITASCFMDQLVQFLVAIKNYDKFLTVNQFQVLGTIRFPNQTQKKINPQLTISGYIYVPGTKP
jgi:hypothetical protein